MVWVGTFNFYIQVADSIFHHTETGNIQTCGKCYMTQQVTHQYFSVNFPVCQYGIRIDERGKRSDLEIFKIYFQRSTGRFCITVKNQMLVFEAKVEVTDMDIVISKNNFI